LSLFRGMIFEKHALALVLEHTTRFLINILGAIKEGTLSYSNVSLLDGSSVFGLFAMACSGELMASFPYYTA
jgi:hypothetical protein